MSIHNNLKNWSEISLKFQKWYDWNSPKYNTCSNKRIYFIDMWAVAVYLRHSLQGTFCDLFLVHTQCIVLLIDFQLTMVDGLRTSRYIVTSISASKPNLILTLCFCISICIIENLHACTCTYVNMHHGSRQNDLIKI